jgi:cytochrome b subunit of formate dehydrogenase
MAESAHVRAVEVRHAKASEISRHSVTIRATHWITTISFLALLVSGIAILLAHPRIYWAKLVVLERLL